jgi:phosphocarrier protein FPr
MITDIAEIQAVRALIEEARRASRRQEPVGVGVMIETPAAALLADRLAAHVDFLSIGTNDLTQYTLAMDRGHPELAPRIDALHPAVLALIARAAEAGRARSRPVAVCGGLASDPQAVAILIGLGVNELSVVPSFIPRLKALLAQLRLPDCRQLAHAALAAESAGEARALGARALAILEDAP